MLTQTPHANLDLDWPAVCWQEKAEVEVEIAAALATLPANEVPNRA